MLEQKLVGVQQSPANIFKRNDPIFAVVREMLQLGVAKQSEIVSIDKAVSMVAVKLAASCPGRPYIRSTLMARIPAARSMSMATRSGVPVVQALTLVAQTVDNAFVAGRIEKMEKGRARK